AVWRFGRHFAARTVVRDFHYAFAAERKSVITGRRNIGTESLKPFRCEEFRLLGFQMKDWLPTRPKKLSRERQQIRSPRADGHHNEVAGDPLSIVEHDYFHTFIPFSQRGKPGAFAQFNTNEFRALHQCRNNPTAFHIARFQLKNAIPIKFRIPRGKLPPQWRRVHALNLVSTSR